MTDSNENPLLEKRTTSQRNETQEANPYNQNKDYLDYDAMEEAANKPYEGANDAMGYKQSNPTVVVDTMIDTDEATQEAEAPQENQPYKKVDYKKRYDDLKKHYDTKVNTFKQKEEELHAQLRANRPKYKAPKSAEELQEFRKNYPDVYDVVESVAHTQTSKELEDLKEELKILRNKNLEISSKEAELTLEKYHPDFSEIRESDEFHQWADKQPEEIKGWIYSNGSNATLAARAIDLFKQDVGKLKSTNNQELSGDLVSSSEMIKVKNNKEIGYGSKKMYTRSQIAAMSQSEFDKNEQAITQAMSEGRVINDMDRSYGGSGNPNY
jgi:hypothetical protein|tara:strand:- start:3401 stop:4375 length:975 start_codon:yes stop_codon:yes gene_type:complete